MLAHSEPLSPLVRIEANRTLGRCRAATGRRAAACEAAECAMAEAGRACYVWMEMRVLRDLREWCEPGDEAAVAARLQAVLGRMVATPAEVERMLPHEQRTSHGMSRVSVASR